jgi:hypothetical protein
MPSKVHWTVQQFLDGYPDEGDDTSLSANLLFYSDRLRCQPDDLKITEIHEEYFLFFRWSIPNTDPSFSGGLDDTEH